MSVQGFLLVEIIIALAVMSICSLTLVMAQVCLVQQQHESYCYITAVNLARTFIEKIQVEGRLPTHTTQKGNFTISWYTLPGKCPTGFAPLRVQISWQGIGGQKKEAVFDTGMLSA